MNTAGRRALNAPRILKIALMGVAALAAISIAILAYLAATFDPMDHRERIAQWVTDQTGRTLELKGNIALSLWPRVEIDVGGFVLHERGRTEPFLEVERMHLVLLLWPLLSGKAEISALEIDGASLRLERDAAGELNIRDLLGNDRGGGQGGVRRVSVRRAHVIFNDLPTNRRVELTGFALEADGLHRPDPSPVAMEARVAGADGDVQLDVKGRGRLAIDPDHQRYALRDVQVTAEGRTPGLAAVRAELRGDVAASVEERALDLRELKVSLEARRAEGPLRAVLHAGQVGFSEHAARAQDIRVTMQARSGDGVLELAWTAPVAEREGDRIALATSTLNVDLAHEGLRVRGDVRGGGAGTWANGAFDFPHLESRWVVSGGRLPPEGIVASLTGAARRNGNGSETALRLAGRIADSPMKADLQVAADNGAAVRFRVDLDHFDLDRLLVAGGRPAATKRETATGDVLDAVAAAPASGTLRIAVLKAGGVEARNVVLALQ